MLKKILLLIFFGCQAVFAAKAQGRATRQCMKFDGLDDYVDCNSGNRNLTNQLTVEAWIKTGAKTDQAIISKLDVDKGFYLGIQNGKAAFSGVTNTGLNVGSGAGTTTLTDNHWHHVAGVFNAGRWEIWVDGILESSATSGNVTLASTGSLILGKNNQTGTSFYKGLLAEVRFWNSARTALQLREFMCKLIHDKPATLTGYFTGDDWHFIVPPGILYDQSFLNLNGTIHSNTATNSIFVLGYPPVGDKSIFLYSNSFQNKSFKMAGDVNDTLVADQISGQVKGIHLYRSDSLTAPILIYTGLGGTSYFFGVYTVGDTNATYRARLVSDTIHCSATFYMFRRFESPLRFDKKTIGNFNPIQDKMTRVTDRYRGEYAFPYMAPKAKLLFNGPVPLCLPGSATLTASAPTGKYFYWNTGDTTKSIVVSNPGKYSVYIYDLCSDIGFDTFRVEIAKPLLFPEIPISDTLVCPQQPFKLNLPANYAYKWQDGDTTNAYEVSQPGRYTLEITEPVCQATVQYSFNVRAVSCNRNAFIPNIITPNGDGLNDAFTIIGLPLSEYVLHIYNRWGNPVYQTENYRNDWNGNEVSAGMYYYLIRHKRSTASYKGYVEVAK